MKYDGKVIFSVCLSVQQRRGGDTPTCPVPSARTRTGYLPPHPLPSSKDQDRVPPPCPPPPKQDQDRAPKGYALSPRRNMPWAGYTAGGCLLRSRRRTFLSVNFIGLIFSNILSASPEKGEIKEKSKVIMIFGLRKMRIL